MRKGRPGPRRMVKGSLTGNERRVLCGFVKYYERRGFLAREVTIDPGLVGMTETPRNCDFAPRIPGLREPGPR